MSAISEVQLYGRIEKVEPQDDGTIMVHGIASTEDVDSVGEIVTAKAMRDALPEYRRFPTIREMHQLSAVGRSLEIDVGEDNVTRVVAHIIDKTAISKVKQNIYSGFSIGGKVTHRNPDNRKVIEGLYLSEISLVDRPANPHSVLEMWKADGMPDNEQDADMDDVIDPETGEEISKRAFDAKQRKKDAKNGTAMKDGSFPIADKDDLENAIHLAGKAKNPAAARAHIKRRAAALGASDMIPDSWKGGDAKKVAGAETGADALEKTIVPMPLSATPVGELMGDTTVGESGTAVNTPVAGKHIYTTLPGGSDAVATAVANPNEAGQATPDPLNETDVPAVEHVAAETPKPGTDMRTNKDAAAGADAISTETVVDPVQKTVDDPIANARAAADAALKAATAVLQRLSKHANGGISAVLLPGVELRKGLPATGRLGCLLCELAYCLSDAQMEKQWEGDDSVVPTKLHAAVESLAAAYKAMSDEELQELLDAADQTMSAQIALAASGGDLAKALDGVVGADVLSKVAGTSEHDALVKTLKGEREDLLKMVGGLTETMTTLAAEVEALKDTPMPPKTITKAADPAILVAVSKEQDGQPRIDEIAKAATGPTEEDVRKALESMSEEERATLLMKAALSPINARVFKR